MQKSTSCPRLLLPFLAPIYDRVSGFAWPLVRVAAGLIMIPHGVPKLFGNFAPVLAERVLAPLGCPSPLYWAYFLGALAIFGGALLAAGCLTRLLALMFAAETAIITTMVSLPKGWIYSVPGGGAEFPALLTVLYVALVLRVRSTASGVGRFSCNRRATWSTPSPGHQRSAAAWRCPRGATGDARRRG